MGEEAAAADGRRREERREWQKEGEGLLGDVRTHARTARADRRRREAEDAGEDGDGRKGEIVAAVDAGDGRGGPPRRPRRRSPGPTRLPRPRTVPSPSTPSVSGERRRGVGLEGERGIGGGAWDLATAGRVASGVGERERERRTAEGRRCAGK